MMIGLSRISNALAAAALALSGNACFPGDAYGQANPVSAASDQGLLRLVRIFAAGEAKVGADSAVVTLSMQVEDGELAKAVERSAAKKGALSTKLKAAGILEADVVFENFSSDGETGFLSNKVRKYTVRSPIRVTVRKESQFAAVAVIVDADAELYYSGRTAEVSDRTKPQMDAAADAVKNLKRKVSLYESEFDVKLTLVSFEELLPGQKASNWNFEPPTANSVSLGRNPLTAGLRSGDGAISGDAIDGLIAAQGSFGELTASVQIQAVYAIEKSSATRQ